MTGATGWRARCSGRWRSRRRWCRIGEETGGGIVIKDAIADITLQQVLTRPEEFDVIATPNLNGDYLSDALRGAGRRDRDRARREHQLRDRHAIFEATHGTAPKYADQDVSILDRSSSLAR